MNELSKIQMIDIEQLCPHPDNPRKSIGDVSELVESIKKNGIMQNLTVVPNGSKKYTYTVIIGHRRLAAAKEAGLTQLPCVVSDMSESEQIATMLAENMQRTDLTVQEEAQGIQLLLDMGCTVEQVSEKTGISTATVHRRTKLMELNQDALKECIDRNEGQISLKELEQLNKIKDKAEQNKLLGLIGTTDFDYAYKRAADKQKAEINKKEFEEWLSKSKCKKLSEYDSSKYTYYKNFFYTASELSDVIKCVEDSKETLYYDCGNHYLSFYKERKEKQNDIKAAKAQEARAKAEQRKAKAIAESREVSNRAAECRADFAKSVTTAMIKKKLAEIAYSLTIMYADLTSDGFLKSLSEMFGKDENYPDDYQAEKEYMLGLIETHPEKSLFFFTFLALEDNANYSDCMDYNGYYEENENLQAVYDFIKEFGYKMSDEEKSFLDGTHEMYIKD